MAEQTGIQLTGYSKCYKQNTHDTRPLDVIFSREGGTLVVTIAFFLGFAVFFTDFEAVGPFLGALPGIDLKITGFFTTGEISCNFLLKIKH